MNTLYRKKSLLISLICLILTAFLFTPIKSFGNEDSPSKTVKKVLYINAYEKGYKWSDDITSSIRTAFAIDPMPIEVEVEYMATHLVDSQAYYETLYSVYAQKYKLQNYDLIITSDDAAFNFVAQYGDRLFPNVPRIFCGVNHYDYDKIYQSGFQTGVIEHSDIEATIKTALSLHPGTQNIYYVNDTSKTGNAIQIGFDTAAEAFPDVRFIPFDFVTFDRTKSADLLPDSLIIFLIYTLDPQGNIYNYRYASDEISQHLDVPMYGQWDFSLDHGIIGGNLTSGSDQGRMVAEMGLDILHGMPKGLNDINHQQTMNYVFDYAQMERFDIAIDDLPENSKVVNYSNSDEINLLILYSYNIGLKMTDDVGRGLADAFALSEKPIAVHQEYMDTKDNSYKDYLYSVQNFLAEKFTKEDFDIVVTVNDNAYEFAKKYQTEIFSNSDIVFCGVNANEATLGSLPKGFTGIYETLDFKGTLDMALSLFPDTKEVVVINDQTTTGLRNHAALNEVLKKNDYEPEFTYLNNLNMSELQDTLQNLDDDAIIFLLSYTEDRSNNNFTYVESMDMIKASTDLPIFSAWDFYLGEGILGGSLFNSYQHGFETGEIVLELINGKSLEAIPVRENSHFDWMFDYVELQRLGVSPQRPSGSYTVINAPATPLDYYRDNQTVINLSVFIIAVIISIGMTLIVLLLRRNLKFKAQLVDREQYYANTDILTGLPNRREGLRRLEVYLNAFEENKPLDICFLDLNNLKGINDTYGHIEGDEAIRSLSVVLSRFITGKQSVCRLGGDEFLIILPNTTESATAELIQSIKLALDDLNSNSNKPYSLSISIGITSYDPASHASLDMLIDEADKRMYKDKLRQKNNTKAL